MKGEGVLPTRKGNDIATISLHKFIISALPIHSVALALPAKSTPYAICQMPNAKCTVCSERRCFQYPLNPRTGKAQRILL